MSNVSGMSRASIYGKNQGIRDTASRKLEDSTREVEHYLGNNQDLLDFIVEVKDVELISQTIRHRLISKEKHHSSAKAWLNGRVRFRIRYM